MRILHNGIAVIDGDTHASAEVERQGTLIYESWIHDLCALLKPQDLCVDAGALIGGYSRGMKDAVGPNGSVISFEPNPEAFECLKHNCPDCAWHRAGLSDRTEERRGHPQANAGSTYFTQISGEHSGTGAAFYRLDKLELPMLNLLKLDVEGMEPLAISGAMETIRRCRPFVWCEVNHACLGRYGFTYVDILRPLLDMGYSFKAVQAGATLKAEEFSQLDLLFTPIL